MASKVPDPLAIKPPRKRSPESRKRLKGKVPQDAPGRPAGPARRRSAEVADLIAKGERLILEAEGELDPKATPLDVMLMAMRRAYKMGGSILASPYAEKAAPYIHARIAQMELKNHDDKPFALSFAWVTSDDPTPEG